MKYLINLLFLLGAAFFLGGCSDDDDPVDTPRLEVSESSLRFGSLATEQVIQVTSSEAWKIANIPDWLSVEPVSGQAGEYEVKVAVIENTTEVERKSTPGGSGRNRKLEFAGISAGKRSIGDQRKRVHRFV